MPSDDNIVATYIFRHTPFINTTNTNANTENMLSCICSISNVDLVIFNYFFNYIINSYIETHKYIAVEHISQSSLINICSKPIDISNMAYFFYNYIHRTLDALSCVIIN